MSVGPHQKGQAGPSVTRYRCVSWPHLCMHKDETFRANTHLPHMRPSASQWRRFGRNHDANWQFNRNFQHPIWFTLSTEHKETNERECVTVVRCLVPHGRLSYTYWPWLRQKFCTTAARNTDYGSRNLITFAAICCGYISCFCYWKWFTDLPHVGNQTTLTGRWTGRKSKTAY